MAKKTTSGKTTSKKSTGRATATKAPKPPKEDISDKGKADETTSVKTVLAKTTTNVEAGKTETEAQKEQPGKKAVKTEDKKLSAARSIFKKYEAAQRVYFSSDNYPFFKENEARMHANTLENNTLTIINKSDV